MACFFKQPGVGSASTSDRVLWPASLQQLAVSFGHDFNQPIVGVESPNSLQRLAFLGAFNQRITGGAWPASLGSCGRPLSLEHLVFGRQFNKPCCRRRVTSLSTAAVVRGRLFTGLSSARGGRSLCISYRSAIGAINPLSESCDRLAYSG